MAEKLDPWAKEGKVIIKPKAYITMLKHVLTYGNDGLGENSVEVMGICMGKEVGNDMVVYEAVPISHGNAIEVGFTPADYAAFAQVDEEYSKRGDGLYACGWYHSHPRMKAFFSKVDIKNHLFYQKEQTPKGFGLVFDHEYFHEPGDPGFRCFRLDDFRKGLSSDFHECKAEVLPPEDLTTYREIMEIIEASQSKQPVVKEIGGLDVDDSVWDFSDEGETATAEVGKKEEPKSPVDELKDAYKEGSQQFSEEFVNKVLESFDEFKNDTITATQKGASVMVDVLADMKEIVDSGVDRVKTYLESILHDEVENIQKSVEEMFKTFDEDSRDFSKKFSEFSQKISDGLTEILTGAISEKLGPAIKLINESANNAKIISSKTEAFKNALNDQQTTLDQFKDTLEKETSTLSASIKELTEKIGQEAEVQSKDLTENISDLKNYADEISELLKQLQQKVS